MTLPFQPLALANRNPGLEPGFRVSWFSIRARPGLCRQVCPDFLTLRDNQASPGVGLDVGFRIGDAESVDAMRVSRTDSLCNSWMCALRGESIRLMPPSTPFNGQLLTMVSRSDSLGMPAPVSPVSTERPTRSRRESDRLTVIGPLPSPLASGRVGPTHALLCARLSPGVRLSRIDSHATADHSWMPACVSRSDSRVSRSLRLPRPLAPLSESDRLTVPGSAFVGFASRLRAWLGGQASSAAPARHPPLLVSRSDSPLPAPIPVEGGSP